jgi:hypothetical protein
MAYGQPTERSVVRFERGLGPRNPVRGEVRKGGGAPSELGGHHGQ